MGEPRDSTAGAFDAPSVLDGLLETGSLGIVVVDADGTLSRFNERAQAILGRSGAEIERRVAADAGWDLVDEDGEPLADGRNPFERVLDAGEAIEDRTLGLRRPSGERIWVTVDATPQWTEEGELVSAIFTFEDVTERRHRERELARYKTLFEQAQDVNVIVDADGRFRHLTPSAASVFGYNPEELIGEVGFEYLHPEDRERAIAEFATMTDEPGYEPELEIRFEHAEGHWIDLEAHARDLRNDPDIEGIVVYTHEITQRKRHERRLAESERRYRALVENFPNGAVAMFDEDLCYTVAGGEILEQLGAAEADIVGQTIWDRYPPEITDQIESRFRSALEGDRDTLELQYRDRYWMIHTHPVENDAGNVVAGMMMVQDLTQRREYQRELERALDLLEKTERIADVGGWEVDPETNEPYWTDHLFELLGFEGPDQPTLERALEVYHTERDRAVVERALAAAIEHGEPFDILPRFTRPDGDVGWLRVQGDPELEDGEVVMVRGAVQDVTERKQREEQLEDLVDRLEESNERLEQFAHAASHDLQEPLRMVSSYLQLIEERYREDLDEEGREFLAFAVDGADRMRAMIEGLLQYSRVDTRGSPFEPVDLETVVENVRQDLQVKIEETDARITVEDLPSVSGDPSQLHQVFQNLLDNAIEYSGDDPPRVQIDAEDRGGRWLVSVRDEGIGIDPADADRVFEVFQRLDATETGTGIGLALCERIVERHDGEIWIDAEPGQGTTVSFTLPAVPKS